MLIKLLRIHGRRMYFSFRISSNSLKRTNFFLLVHCLLSSFVCQLDATNNHKISTTQQANYAWSIAKIREKKRCWNLCNNLWQSLNVIPRKLITFDFIFLWTKLCLCVCVSFFQWRVQKKICTQRLLSDSKHIQAQNSVYVVQGRMAIGVYNFEFLLWAHIESVTFCLLMLLRLMLMLPLLLLLPFEFQDFGHRLIRAQAI